MASEAATEEDRALKAKHRSMWSSGDYPTLADDLLPELGVALTEACEVRTGDRVLDVTAGSGNATIPAAVAGATVVAEDLSPELLDAGRRRAVDRGVEIEWREADAEALPFADREFDVVMSCLGVMFAPHHQAAADELVRVCRPGGRIGLLNWTPSGFVGQLFATMKPYAAPPPAGASPPPQWGDEVHVRELFGDRVTELTSRSQTLRVSIFNGADTFREYFKARYGPTIATYRNVAGDPDRVAALDRELDELAGRHTDDAGMMEWEYLLLTGRRAG